ncbi:MAG: UDP-N-acetylmuramoyl-tripeptide--D-alanyl-D-alanine ligase [Flavobacteriaceae bacterium]
MLNIAELHQHFLKSSSVCTDTRKITPNCIFFALKGENFNGNQFAKEAIEKGALLAVIDEEEYLLNKKTWLCDDVLKTLQELATFHRNFLNIPIVGLTGSNGKTTTKELIHAVLSEKYNCIATQGNLNNHIGVPLTLLSMNANTEIGVVEMGANHLGEIELLANIAQPNFGYITNFGKAHLEGFGSLEGVIKGKTELFQYLKYHNQYVFINGEDTKQVALSEGMQRILFNDMDSSIQIQLKDASNQLKVIFENTEITTQLIGAYNFSNIAAAIAVGHYFNVPTSNIKKALEGYIPQMNRSQIIEKSTHKIILDAYNANPTSMMAALINFKNVEGKNKILILGDMFELGPEATYEHQNIVNFIEENPFAETFLVGKNFYGTNVRSKRIHKFETFEAYRDYLLQNPITNQFILIKGSRGMALERILNVL